MSRATFATRLGTLLTMVGVAAGLGNVWRFPYMVGRSGGAAFVLFYLAAVLFVGVPALAAEWTLGRHTRRGTAGAFARAGLPLGKPVGWTLFGVMAAAAGYYTAVMGWVAYHALAQLAEGLGLRFDPSGILPPERGFSPGAWLLQAACTAGILLACAAVLVKGLRSGIEAASRLLVPALFVALIALIARSTTLPGAAEGLAWYILKFDPGALGGEVMVTALGQAMFSLSLGGTFMVVYGSYLDDGEDLLAGALWTAAGDTTVGLLAGLAIFPAVFALGLEPGAGPELIFSTLPAVFGQIPVGWLFGLLFFGGLFGAAFLSDVAGLEVLVAGITDNTSMGRRHAVWLAAGGVFLLSLPPTLSLGIFVPWDLAFGSGMQTVGALLAALTVGWAVRRSAALRQLASADGRAGPRARILLLYLWIRYVVPTAILLVGAWWFLTEVLGAGG